MLHIGNATILPELNRVFFLIIQRSGRFEGHGQLSFQNQTKFTRFKYGIFFFQITFYLMTPQSEGDFIDFVLC